MSHASVPGTGTRRSQRTARHTLQSLPNCQSYSRYYRKYRQSLPASHHSAGSSANAEALLLPYGKFLQSWRPTASEPQSSHPAHRYYRFPAHALPPYPRCGPHHAGRHSLHCAYLLRYLPTGGNHQTPLPHGGHTSHYRYRSYRPEYSCFRLR